MSFLRRKSSVVSEYLDEAVYGANDGIITTFAVVSGAAGATFSSETVVIFGIANLVADGFSMGASSFLSIKTEQDVQRSRHKWWQRKGEKALPRSLTTFAAFVVAGTIPLLPFLNSYDEGNKFLISAIAAAVTFFLVGGARTFVTKRGFFTSGLEMLTIGGIAAILAYSVGWIIRAMIV